MGKGKLAAGGKGAFGPLAKAGGFLEGNACDGAAGFAAFGQEGTGAGGFAFGIALFVDFKGVDGKGRDGFAPGFENALGFPITWADMEGTALELHDARRGGASLA